MKAIRAIVQTGKIGWDVMRENPVGQRSFKGTHPIAAAHQLEAAGAWLRAMMPRTTAGKLVDRTRSQSDRSRKSLVRGPFLSRSKQVS